MTAYVIDEAKLEEMRLWQGQVREYFASVGPGPDIEDWQKAHYACRILGECLAHGPEVLEIPESIYGGDDACSV